MLKESTYPLLPHIRLQACGIGLAQVDQDQAVEDAGETLVHVEGQDFTAALEVLAQQHRDALASAAFAYATLGRQETA